MQLSFSDPDYAGIKNVTRGDGVLRGMFSASISRNGGHFLPIPVAEYAYGRLRRHCFTAF